eukprot:5875501-Lingulodinium_polyedra.AAC.1
MLALDARALHQNGHRNGCGTTVGILPPPTHVALLSRNRKSTGFLAEAQKLPNAELNASRRG